MNKSKPLIVLTAVLMAATSLQACSEQDNRAARESFEETADRFRDGVEDLGERTEETAEELGESARSAAKTAAERTERAAEDLGNAARATLDTGREKTREFIDSRRDPQQAD